MSADFISDEAFTLFPFTSQRASRSATANVGEVQNLADVVAHPLADLLPDDYRYEGRSRRPAGDMFNAFLNYGYGILYRIVERALLLVGEHPYIGFMHYDGYQRRSMVFDFIEPFRIWVEKTVFKLFVAKQPTNQHLRPAPNASGGFWLNEEGKRLLSDALHLRLRKKKKEVNGRRFPLEASVVEVAYDIRHNRTRRLVAKWCKQAGC